jgi:hypothetical protein
MPHPRQSFDRTTQDVGNIVFFEHVNLRVPDQGLATLFYLEGLGLTRDPYYMVGTGNMWVNIGRQQLHLESGPAQRFRGSIGLVLPDLEALRRRLSAIAGRLAGTRHRLHDEGEAVAVACPWGNAYRVHGGRDGFPWPAGIAYAAMDVPAGAASRIAAFYADVLQADVRLEGEGRTGARARVCVGPGQELIYTERREAIPAFDGHHICIYLAAFSNPYRRLKAHGLVTSEDNAFQYRFEQLRAPGEEAAAYLLQHEVRSLYHPLYLRPLVNRTGEERLP